MEFDLTGKRALITGSSRGIGSAIAVELAKGGADIAVHCAGNVARAEEVAEKITALGRKAQVFQADLSNPDEAATLMDRVGPVDILVLNASIQIRKKWEEITVADFRQQVDCNLLASMLLMQKAVPSMREKHWGRIITIGSVQEAKPHPEMLIYAASKCGQTALVRSLSVQLAPLGITVNNIAPGVINTDRNREALSDEAYARLVSSLIPMGYYGEKEDCAGIVRLLCSKEGRYITGQSIYVDGGKSL